MVWEIARYHNSYEEQWDRFVLDTSLNGTFLQTRRFLNYHPKGRFEDCSLIFLYKKHIHAVCPACRVVDNGSCTFYSHGGSTFGGIIFDKDSARLDLLAGLIGQLEQYLKENKFDKILLKPTSPLFCQANDDSCEFALSQAGYKEYKELSLYIDFGSISKQEFYDFSTLKKRCVKQCIRNGMVLKELLFEEEIEEFHAMLSENLKKYGVEPVHSTDELIDLSKNRCAKEIKFWGGYVRGEMVSGTMVFDFPRERCVHTQYLAAKKVEGLSSPMSFIYYAVLVKYLKLNYRYLSWGTATEHFGREVNWGLMKSKEAFGSRHCVNHIFEKDLV